jgi:hypothetical protein
MMPAHQILPYSPHISPNDIPGYRRRRNEVDDMRAADICRLRIRGELGKDGSKRFPDMSVISSGDGETVLRGPVADQARLYGLIRTIRDAGLELLEIRRETDSPQG